MLSRNRYQETNDDTEHNGDNDEGLINTKSDDERVSICTGKPKIFHERWNIYDSDPFLFRQF